MPIYRDFQSIEEYIVLILQYRVSQYSKGQWFILSFSAENSENSPEIPKILWKFLKKKDFSEAKISYQTFNTEYFDILKASDLFCLFSPKILR